MMTQDRAYYQKRAMSELAAARGATHEKAREIHRRLAACYANVLLEMDEDPVDSNPQSLCDAVKNNLELAAGLTDAPRKALKAR